MHAAFRARCLIQAGREAHADPALPLPTLTRATATSSKELFFSGRSTRRPATDTLAPAPTPASDLQPPSDRHASLDRGPRLVPLHRHAAMPLPAGDRLAGSTAPQARPSAYASLPANRKRAQTLRSPASPGSVFVSPCASRHRPPTLLRALSGLLPSPPASPAAPANNRPTSAADDFRARWNRPAPGSGADAPGALQAHAERARQLLPTFSAARLDATQQPGKLRQRRTWTGQAETQSSRC